MLVLKTVPKVVEATMAYTTVPDITAIKSETVAENRSQQMFTIAATAAAMITEATATRTLPSAIVDTGTDAYL